MLGIAYGINAIGTSIPVWLAYIENGLVSVAVGLVALAAYKLAKTMYKTDIQIFLGFLSFSFASAYSSTSWLYPVIMACGGLIMFAWRKFESLYLDGRVEPKQTLWKNGYNIVAGRKPTPPSVPGSTSIPSGENAPPRPGETIPINLTYGTLTGGILIATALLVFVLSIILRHTSAYAGLPRAFQLFITMFEAGVIIFGGGPVVIPLLSGYIVDQGWCTSQEFLIGLAFINACPGPNFNFAVYLGALALRTTSSSLFAGALLGNLGIFAPGLLLIAGFLPFWHRARTHSTVRIVLDGVNAAAVGLVFSAAYQLWEKAIVPIVRDGNGNVSVSGTGRVLSVGDFPLYAILAAFGFVACGIVAKWKFSEPWAIAAGGVVGVLQWLAIGR
ncbi:hypothetical protein HDU93_002049 [Gonapodya sp. JEL0774]|nr:hypothetical protein HDU93_002049 [Gonapodya sp. JEL0774]